MHRFVAAAAAALALCGAAAAQERPSQFRSIAFLGAIAERGEACARLAGWQGAVLRAQVADAARSWTDAQRDLLTAEIATRGAAMACDDEAMNLWITGAQRGMEAEMLAHYIVAYAALSRMQPQPRLFTQTSTRADHGAARTAIAAKIGELEASGAVAEGGHAWPVFVARTGAAIEEMARAHEAGETPARASRAQAEAWIRDSVTITELWLATADAE